MSTTNPFQEQWDEEGTPPAPPVTPRPKVRRDSAPTAARPPLYQLQWPPTESDSAVPIRADERKHTAVPEQAGTRSPERPVSALDERQDLAEVGTEPGDPATRPSPAPGGGRGELAEELPVQTAVSSAQSAQEPPAPLHMQYAAQTREARVGLSDETLRKHRGDIPGSGWRRVVYTASGHLINPGPGPDEIRRNALRARVTAPLRSSYRVATISIKGGVGKTTVTACSGFALAEIRGDQVAVVDGNPDAGTLADRLTGETSVTIRDLLANLDEVTTLTSVQGYMSLAGRLKILASDQDPAISESLAADEYVNAINKLCRFFNIVVTDCGTGMVHPTMRPTLDMADRFVIVGGVTIDAASRAGHTLSWLKEHGYEQKARDAVVVLNEDRRSPDVDARYIRDHFADEVTAHGCHGGVVTVPHDPHLAAGGRIEFGRLKLATQDAFTEVAALIADGFAGGRAAAY